MSTDGRPGPPRDGGSIPGRLFVSHCAIWKRTAKRKATGYQAAGARLEPEGQAALVFGNRLREKQLITNRAGSCVQIGMNVVSRK